MLITDAVSNRINYITHTLAWHLGHANVSDQNKTADTVSVCLVVTGLNGICLEEEIKRQIVSSSNWTQAHHPIYPLLLKRQIK